MSSKAVESDPVIVRLLEIAGQHDDLAALWLYGSRARGDHHPASDYDLAVAFTTWLEDPLERRLRPELLAMEWQRALGLEEGRLSIVDMAICPIPLGWSILSEGRRLLDRHPQLRMTQESRIMSRWELDYWHRTQRHG